MQEPREDQKLNDRWMFLFVYPIMTIGVVHIGNDNTLAQLIFISSYYTDLLLAAICTFGSGFYFRYFFAWLYRNFDWSRQLRSSVMSQVQYGLLLPLAVIVLLEVLYLWLFGIIPLEENTILYLEMPLILIFLLIINLCYFILYYRSYTSNLVNKLPASHPTQHHVLVVIGAKTLQIPVQEVAYFIKLEKFTFLRTLQREQFLYDLPLDQIFEKLDDQTFFQLNRQVIASRESIRSYATTATRKLSVELDPPVHKAVFVSKAKAAQFADWLHQA